MNFPLYIAKRYLFSKSKNNAINIITGIASIGIIVGTLALFVVLSVFSGLRDFSLSFSNTIDPDKLLLSLPFKAIARHKVYSKNRFYTLALEIRDVNHHNKTMAKLPYPNSFNGTVHIPFIRNVDGEEVRLNVYDMTGRLVKSLVRRRNIGQDEFVVHQLLAGAEFNYELFNGQNKYTGKLISVQQE